MPVSLAVLAGPHGSLAEPGVAAPDEEAEMDESGRDPYAPRSREFAETTAGTPPSARGGRSNKPRRRVLDDLRPLVRDGRYRLARHAVRHAAAEGFTERDIVATVLHGRELVRYVEDERLLVLGWLPVSAEVKLPLHVVLEFAKPRFVDVVTAFIPRDPHRPLSRSRLAEVLRWDGHEPLAELHGQDVGGKR